MPDTFLPARQPRIGGATKASRPRVNRVRFEGGYTQRSAPGPNALEQTLTLEWDGLTDAEASAITSFLEAKGGVTSFFYTAPGDGSATLWTCAEWSRATLSPTADRVSASFTREWDIL